MSIANTRLRRRAHWTGSPGAAKHREVRERSGHWGQRLVDFLREVTCAFESRYTAQINRYDDNLQADMMNCAPAQPHHTPDPNDTQTDPY